MKPGHRASPALDEGQRAVVGLGVEASGVVIGGPGTGKTATLVARAARLLHDGVVAPEELLVLTPTRQTATALRDRVAAGLDVATPGPLARSVASFAFQLVRAAAVAGGAAPPQLLTAGDQDRIIAELLIGDEEDAAAGRDRWPESLGTGVRRSRPFRSELRALFAQCSDLGLRPAELSALGEASGRETWVAAAGFLEDYRYALSRMRSAHRDPAELVHEAADLLAEAGPERIGPAAGLRVLLVDDAQELTRGGIALLEAARRRGIAVVAFGDPDIGSGAFRGAGPELFERLVAMLETVHVLDGSHRGSRAITHLTRSITASIGVSGRVEHRRAPGEPVADERIQAVHASSPFEEVDRIARILRTWHVMDGIPWDELAVIAHDTRQVAHLEAELAAREVPVRAGSAPRPLGREPVVRDIASLVRLGLEDPAERDPEALADALLTPFGGLDAVGLRRVRARLRTIELAAGGSRSAKELLAEAMAEPAVLALIDAPDAHRAERLATTLRLVHEAGERGATVHELLWLVWDRSGLEREWARRASGTGPLAAEAGRALDALVALFGAAKRYVERSGADASADSGPAPFLRDILDSEVPEDLLTVPERPGAVSLLTPAAALGTEFEAVVIAGVQEGVWPNTRLRGGLLDVWRLADDIDAWRAGRPSVEPAVLDRRRGVLHEELRLFARAVSRARTRLVVTAVDDDDLGPSPLFSYLPPPSDDEGARNEHPLTLRGLVALHRRALTTSRDAAARVAAADQLVLLAEAGVAGARPDEWYGVAPPTSTAPVHDLQRAPVRVSPSRLEGFEKCGLDWVIRTLGGDTRSFSAGLGTILHAAMERGGGIDELRAVVDERWGELDFEAPWLERQERTWADTLVRRLDAYLRRFENEGGEPIGAETRFRLEIDAPEDPDATPRVRPYIERDPATDSLLDASAEAAERPLAAAVLSGSIDRVELYPPDRGEAVPLGSGARRVVVVDLKTGRSEDRVSDAKVVEDAQLAAYQLAIDSGLVELPPDAENAGARLLVLSRKLKDTHYRIAHQKALTPETRAQFLRRVIADARGMAASSFIANVDQHCTTDRFGVCRLHTVKAVSSA
ncbi:ATP-dependent DNA helicase [Microbacterium sp.]|uniref:ATP-dependent helicase n=1 Tax=Microbacterium sp. TaxID=51671 RepID=UPI002D7A0BD1|nr:ATP-dependent DNA helicase [Microbacterium sp.]HET6302128.1 ATP-dependent DNA helicase [Microbacterium sp.]